MKEKPTSRPDKFHFHAVVEGDESHYGLNTEGASFKQLSYLLACCKILERMLVEHLDNIQPEFELTDKEDPDE